MCKIFLINNTLYEENIKNLLIDLVDHEKIKDVRICISKVLKAIMIKKYYVKTKIFINYVIN